MGEIPNEAPDVGFQQADFERITAVVAAEFQIEESLMEHSLPTYFLKQPQETKEAFLKLLKKLESMNLIALLRRVDGRIVLKVVRKPPARPSNIKVNWILFFATIFTTFITGYLLSSDVFDPFVGGATFTIAIMAILGMHEMGHKITANRKGIEATPPYFIPGPPSIGGLLGIGTFGAVIMQKSLPRNKDALFDVGSSGPIIGFILAAIVSVIGLAFSPVRTMTGTESFLPSPLIFELFAVFLIRLSPDQFVLLHPVAFAGWAGMLLTMLNILPAAMLDGGHVARAVVGEKMRLMLTGLSILLLVAGGFIPMAIFVLFISMYKHPGPLDDVSELSTGRKLTAVGMVMIFVLCSYVHYLIFDLLSLLGL